MIVEKPDDEELKFLLENYGSPRWSDKEVHFPEKVYKGDYSECKGEAVIRIRNEEGKTCGVRHFEGTRFVMPQGRVWKDESFVDGVEREALEETGLEVEVLSLKEIRRLEIKFKNELLERWNFLFECEITGGFPEPNDTDEIEEVDFFEEVPWKSELY